MSSTTDNKTVEEDYYIKKYFKENYALSLFLKAGGLYGDRESGHFVYLIAISFLITAVTLIPFLFTTVYHSNGKEMELVCEAIHFIIFVVLEIAGLVSFLMNKSVLAEIFTLMGKGFYDYQSSLDEECLIFIDRTLDRSKRKKTLIAKLFIVVVMCACVAISIIRPIMKFLLGEHRLGTPDDGFLRLLPVTLWTPFDKGTWYVSFIFFVLEDIVAYVTPGIVFGATLFCVCSCEDIGSQFIILGYTLKTVVRRAESLNMSRDEAIRLCFSHSIRHHQIILKSIKTLETVLRFPGFGLLSGSTFMMCMSGFIFVSKEVSFPTKLAFCLFLVSELAMIFIICWCGELIQQTSSVIFEMVYFSEWPDNMKLMKNYILIIQLRSMEPVVLSFGGLIVASYETFNNICSSAFSYFNILLAVS